MGSAKILYATARRLATEIRLQLSSPVASLCTVSLLVQQEIKPEPACLDPSGEQDVQLAERSTRFVRYRCGGQRASAAI